MSKYFEVKVKYSKIDEQTGKERIVCEPYLVDAMSFTEAEAFITKKMSDFVNSEFVIPAIKRSNYAEIVRNSYDFDKWFAFKVAIISIDERVGKEKETFISILVNADDIEASKINLIDYLKTTMFDYRIEAIKETKIVEVFDYEEAKVERCPTHK